MKKITKYIIIMLAMPVLIYAQYTGGVGRGDAMLEKTNSPLTHTSNNINLVPASYSLFQNYPNPFNPSTTIRYEIPKNGLVKLVVYDVLGRSVETLVNEKQSAGIYEINFDASQIPSGIYFYKLTVDNFSDIKRMVLLK
jgi:hypothetical protein